MSNRKKSEAQHLILSAINSILADFVTNKDPILLGKTGQAYSDFRTDVYNRFFALEEVIQDIDEAQDNEMIIAQDEYAQLIVDQKTLFFMRSNNPTRFMADAHMEARAHAEKWAKLERQDK